MRDFPCSCDVQSFGICVCSDVVNISFGKPVNFLDRLNAALFIFSTEKVVKTFCEIDYPHVFCDFLDETTKKQIMENIAPTHLSAFSHHLVSFSGRFFAHVISKKYFCVECLTHKEILKIYRKVVLGRSGGIDKPVIIYREEL